LREDREIRNPIVRLLARFMDGRGPTVDGYLKALVSRLGKSGITPARSM
jgi:cytochrome c1